MQQAVTRIGCLIPQGNVVCEQEFPPRMPAGFSIHFQRLARVGTAVTRDALLGMKTGAIESSAIFEPLEPALIVYACTSGTFLSGPLAHDEVAGEIRQRQSVSAVTTSTALLLALQALELRRVLMVTPYPAAVNEAEIRFLAFHGTEVVACSSFECVDFKAIRAIREDQTVAMIEAAVRRSAAAIDGVFISCTNLASLSSIDALEQAIGRPVISSNGVTLWAALRQAGYTGVVPDTGALGRLSLPRLRTS